MRAHHDKRERVEVVYRGNVQGVGFRYTALRLSESFAVTGTVRNEWDGSVYLAAEGEHSAITNFLTAIRQSPLDRYIHGCDIQWRPAKGEYTRFSVSF